MVVTNRSNTGELATSVCDEVLTKYMPNWRWPDEDCGFPIKPFMATPEFEGRWQGLLEGDGARMLVEVNIESSEAATLTIGSSRAEAINEIRSEGEAFAGVSIGKIDAPDARRTALVALQATIPRLVLLSIR
jgi:hypothetical protein